MSGFKIVLTSDRATMTDYSGLNALGFLLCVPARLIPRFLVSYFIAPKIKTDRQGRAILAPYALRKVEAALYMYGFTEEDVIVTTPEMLGKVVNEETKIVAIHVLDPLGKAPVSYTLSTLMGGGNTWTKELFLEFMRKVRKLKEKYKFKVIVGGPGTWQLKDVYRELGIDLLIHGEGEAIFPEVCKRILQGEDISGEVDGGSVPLEMIPAIRHPARGGMVQITRGCPKRCRFCNPTMFNFRSIPLERIKQEVEINKRAGFRHVGLVTEDGFLYGARGVRVNKDAVLKLKKLLQECEVTGDFTHVSISSVLQAPELVEEWALFCNYSENKPYFVQIGVETGSVRLMKMYMAGKPAPWKVEDWPWMVIEATSVMNEYYWYPCYTLILGLPGETEDDVKATLELMRKLRGTRCWMFPLLFVPMGRSMLEDKEFAKFVESDLYREIIYEMLNHNIEFTKTILDKLLSRVQNKFVRNVVYKFMSASIRAIEEFKEEVRYRLPELIQAIGKVNLNNVVDLGRFFVNYVLLSKLRGTGK